MVNDNDVAESTLLFYCPHLRQIRATQLFINPAINARGNVRP